MTKQSRPTIAYAAALLLLVACGAAIALIYSAPEPGLPSVTVEPARCEPIEQPNGTVLTVTDVEHCAAAFPYTVTACVDGAALTVLFTPDTRWALRAGDPPIRLRHDDDLALVRAWCAAASE